MAIDNPFALGGIQLIASSALTVDGDPVTVRRTWRERLFTRPWRPFKATHTYTPQVPSPTFYPLGPNKLVGHPETIRALKENLNNAKDR